LPSLNTYISFDAKFVLSSEPVLVLTAKTTLTSVQQQQVKGYFTVTMPDGITTTGSFTNPHINFESGKITYEIPVRKDTLGSYQQGGYDITFSARHPDYTDGAFNRYFGMEVTPVKQTIRVTADYFTPLIKYEDLTSYIINDYTIADQIASWVTVVDGINSVTSSTTEVNPAINGKYYATAYITRYIKSVLYQSIDNPWLSALVVFEYTATAEAYAPLQMSALVVYLEQLKNKTQKQCGDPQLQALFEKASSLYTLIRGKVCARDTANLKTLFEEYYALTHDGAPLAYPANKAEIPPYDFVTGCSGSNTGTAYRNYPAVLTATFDGQTVLPMTLPAYARIISAVKGIVHLEPSDYSYTSTQFTLLNGLSMSFSDDSAEKIFITYETRA